MDTIGKLYEAHFIAVYCQHCARSVTLDGPALIARLGPDFLLTRLVKGLRCGDCGSKAVQISIVWAGMREFRYGAHVPASGQG